MSRQRLLYRRERTDEVAAIVAAAQSRISKGESIDMDGNRGIYGIVCNAEKVAIGTIDIQRIRLNNIPSHGRVACSDLIVVSDKCVYDTIIFWKNGTPTSRKTLFLSFAALELC